MPGVRRYNLTHSYFICLDYLIWYGHKIYEVFLLIHHLYTNSNIFLTPEESVWLVSCDTWLAWRSAYSLGLAHRFTKEIDCSPSAMHSKLQLEIMKVAECGTSEFSNDFLFGTVHNRNALDIVDNLQSFQCIFAFLKSFLKFYYLVCLNMGMYIKFFNIRIWKI